MFFSKFKDFSFSFFISEFNEDILFSLPRIKRNDFYQEVKQINKLKKYFPEKLLQT